MISRKLALGLRRNQCKQIRDDFLQEMSAKLEKSPESIQFLDLEETVSIEEEFFRLLRLHKAYVTPSYKGYWPNSDVEKLREVIHALLQAPDKPAILIRSEKSHYCGAIRIGTSEVFQHALQLAELGGEDSLLVTENFDCGMQLGFNTDPSEHGPQDSYELTLWGDEWLRVLESI